MEDMTWRREPSVGDVGRTNKSIPTWSWARDDMPKCFIAYDRGGDSLPQLCDLVEGVCEADAVSCDSFLGIQPGSHVILSGYLLPARVTSVGIFIDENPRMHYCHSKNCDWSSGSSGRRPVRKADRVFALPLVLRDSIHGAEGYGGDFHAVVLRFNVFSGRADISSHRHILDNAPAPWSAIRLLVYT